MKTEIHPDYYPEAVVTCSCGNVFTTGATKPAIKVEICSSCHPFFTGRQKLVDTAGRVERFIAKYGDGNAAAGEEEEAEAAAVEEEEAVAADA